VESAIFVLIVSIFCSAVAGGVAAWLFTWGLWRSYLDLQYRVEDLEGRVVREVKIRAGEKSRLGRESDEKLDKWAAEQREASSPLPQSSMKSLMDWRRDKMQKG
jgi:hypothetical protein